MTKWPLLFFFLSALSFGADKSDTPKSNIQSIKIMKESFDFLHYEKDKPSLEEWSKKVLAEYYFEYELIEKLLSYFVDQKDRVKVIDAIRRLSIKNRCMTSFTLSKLCGDLKELWLKGLFNLPFYESTAGQLREIEEALTHNECDQAARLSETLEKTEGPLLQNLQLLEKAYLCLNDEQRLDRLKRKVAKLSIF